MKRVAIVAPDFVPSGLPPALRIRFFAHHLPEFGWEPVVITTNSTQYNWQVDPDNELLVRKDLEVIHTHALPMSWSRRLGVGDIGIRSLWHNWRALSGVCRDRKVDLVFISVPPYVTSLLGRLAHRRLGIPYVLDYIDPWVSDIYLTLPVSQRPGGRKYLLAHAMAQMLEPIALRQASYVTAVSQGTIDTILGQYPWLRGIGTAEIPYGGEPADVEFARLHPRENGIFDRDDGLVHVSYLGTVGAGMRGVVRAILQAVRLGIEREPERFGRIRLHFVGTTYGAVPDYQVLPVAEEAGVAHLVVEHPQRIPYLDALRVLQDSHALLVVGSEEVHYTASKLYPYIMARRPLLAVFHERSSVVEIMRETQAGTVVAFGAGDPPESHVEEIREHLSRLLDVREDDAPPTRWDIFERYTARSMTARLARAFDAAVEAGATTQASVNPAGGRGRNAG
jgi:hypothetical protein